jgi:hypothetical protein
MDPETGDWVEVTEEGIRLGLSLSAAPTDTVARNDYLKVEYEARIRGEILDGMYPDWRKGGTSEEFRAAIIAAAPLDREKLASAIRSNWYEIRPVGGEWVRPQAAADAIADAYESPAAIYMADA